MSSIEANIAANLQAKLSAGATKEELLAQSNAMDLVTPAPAVAPNAAAVVAQVLAKHKAPAAQAATPVAKKAPAPATAAPAEDTKASQDKVREMAQKLGIPFTSDLMALGSNSAISDALIEKAVSAGKTEAEINAAMAQL